MKTVAILQSCYIPWKGYFDIIRHADVFIIYDDIAYSKNNWRNRNQIKTPQGIQWLTIPVHHTLNTRICDVTVNDTKWADKHWKSFNMHYAKSPYFKHYSELFYDTYQQSKQFDHLSDINYCWLKTLCQLLNINTPLHYASDYPHQGDKTEKLIQICQAADATHYLTGPAANNYMNTDLFKAADINILYMDYQYYPVYRQLYGAFTHSVTCLDLIFNTGPEAIHYLSDRCVTNQNGELI